MTDEELLHKIKNGDETAENELFDRYKDLVVKISRGYFLVGGDLEDLVQEGMFGLFKAIKAYSPHKEASFKTFAILCIKRQIQTAIRKSTSAKNKPLSTAVSLQSFSQNENESLDFLPIELVLETTPAEKVIDKENFEDIQNIIKKNLSQKEISVLKLYLQGFSYKEISTTLNLSQKSIDNCLFRIKNKLREKISLN